MPSHCLHRQGSRPGWLGFLRHARRTILVRPMPRLGRQQKKSQTTPLVQPECGEQFWPCICLNITPNVAGLLPFYCPALAWQNARPWWVHVSRVRRLVRGANGTDTTTQQACPSQAPPQAAQAPPQQAPPLQQSPSTTSRVTSATLTSTLPSPVHSESSEAESSMSKWSFTDCSIDSCGRWVE